MTRAVWIALLLCLGCDSKPAATDAAPAIKAAPTVLKSASPDAQDGPTTGPITVTGFKLIGSQNAYQTPGAPKPDQIQQEIVADLNASKGFQAAGGRPAQGSATYEIRVEGGKTEVMIFGGLKAKGDSTRGLQAEVMATDADVEAKDPAAVVAEAKRQFVRRIVSQARVGQANNDELVELLNDGEARLVALQELRDRRLREATPKVREFLADPDAGVRVAAAATLVAFEDAESYSAIVEAAEGLSRERNPQLMPMLYIVADISTDEARTYLQALADGHELEAVRKVAGEALAKKP